MEELQDNKLKLLRLSGIKEVDFNFLQRILFNRIEILDVELISPASWLWAYDLTKDVDESDTPFVALSKELESPLWTGDKKLIKGLSSKGIDWLLTTKEVRHLKGEY